MIGRAVLMNITLISPLKASDEGGKLETSFNVIYLKRKRKLINITGFVFENSTVIKIDSAIHIF